MKKLSLILLFVTLASSAFSQSQFAGTWMGVLTPNKNGIGTTSGWWDRSTIYFDVAFDGSVVGNQWDFLAETIWDDFSGAVTPTGKLYLVTFLGDTVTLSLSKSGKGTGVWKTPHPEFTTLVVRHTVTLYRRNPR